MVASQRRFQQMGGETVAQRMGVDGLGDSGAAGGLATGVPDALAVIG